MTKQNNVTSGRVPRLTKIFVATTLFFTVGSFAIVATAQGISVAQNARDSNAPPAPLGTQSAQNDPSVQVAPPEQDSNQPPMQVFQGTGKFVNAAGAKATTDQAGDVTLDFSDADIHDVVRSVFGDILQKSYTIDPKVTGHITLKTGRPIPKEAVLPALETALKINGAAVSLTQDIYNIVPIADAQRRGQIIYGSDESQVSGYGIEIVPLQFVSAEEIQHVITPLIPEGGIVQIDSKLNLIFLAGTEPERAAIRDTIARFDVDYLKGMSFALIQPVHVDVSTLVTELDKIFDESGSPIAGLVRLVPISRINNLLVITSRPDYLREVHRWVERLDIVPITPDRKLYYYRLQNAKAHDIAETLGKIFGTSESQTVSAEQAPNWKLGAPSSAVLQNQTAIDTSPPPTVAPSQLSGQNSANTSLLTSGRPAAGGPQIVTDEANNALIIRADAADYAAIEDVIKKMDVTPSQVLVEATIVEVTLNNTLKYGVEWSFTHGSQTFTSSQDGSVSTQFPGFGYTYTVPNVSVALSALGALTNIRVLSSPKILTMDNTPATIEVGDEIPIVSQTSVSTVGSNSPIVSSIEERDTGVILSVTPRVGDSGVVYLDISQEVSASTPTTSSGIDSPTIQQRRIHTAVAINNGATIALGGLIQDSVTSGDSGLPYLKDIPILGGLFSSKNNSRDRTELLIFLTPRVIRNLPTALNETERLKQGMQDLRDAIQKFDQDDSSRMSQK